ncbi:MAG: hypothetical protein ACUVRH_02385 [Candidatus Bipolaricaulia bacterium]
MKTALAIGSIVLLILGGSALGALAQVQAQAQAQKEDLSAGRGWGFGVRFLPQALMPLALSEVDPALTTAVTLKYWTKGSLGFEAGGWLSRYSDTWSSRDLTSLSGGALFKLYDSPRADLYLAGRAISLQSFYKDGYIICKSSPSESGPPPAEEDEPVPPPPCWPSSTESRSATLAVSLAAGLEWSRSQQVAMSFEVELVYAQTMTTMISLPPPAPVPEEEPAPLPSPEQQTFGSSSLGLTLSLSLDFYLPQAGLG